MESVKTECDKCGTCCEKGGPALHIQDRDLLTSGIIGFADMVAIRAGEMVVQLDSGKPETTEVELIKLQGRDGQWCCRFLDPATRTCTIYEHRPQACRLQQCWDTGEVRKIAGQKLLSRFDLIAEDDPLLPLVRLHDQQCALPDMVEIAVSLEKADQRDRTLADLKGVVEKDLMFRTIGIDQFQLSLPLELFYFGRPLFQVLMPLGVRIMETADGIILQYSEE
jgi:Fe-S-cluster containining protein